MHTGYDRMSLVGNLEDLGLGEILQIVSLSHKSGILTLQSTGRQGIIVFRNGQVIRATSNQGRRFLGELLVEQGVLDETSMQQALQLQQERGFKDRIGTILAERFHVSAEQIEAVARKHVEQVVYSLFTWQEGSFEFELEDNLDAVDAIRDPLQFILSQGLNPQFLAMEGSRIFDEMRYHQQHTGMVGPPPEVPDPSVESPDSGTITQRVDLAFDLLQGAAASAAEGGEAAPFQWDAVLVDDDEATRDFLGQTLRSLGFEVAACAGSEEALITIDTRYRQQGRPLVLVDLIMPRMDGSGILGGLELLELLRNNFPEITALAVSDYHNSDAERRLLELGYSLLLKPKRSELDAPEVAEAFTQRLQAALVATSGSSTARPGAGVNLGDEIRRELGEAPARSEADPVTSTGIALLRGILEELSSPSLGGGVILLALRFASEFMNRAVIFTVKDHEIVGLGQFGINPVVGLADDRLRALRIPRTEESLFSQVFRSRQPCKLHPPLGKWNEQLFGQLGGGVPHEVFLGPIISDDEVVAILYGDNLPETKPIGDTDSLEIFLSQAGMVTEKALLQDRLKEKGLEVT
jgi:CheY-like chemotaxis protein